MAVAAAGPAGVEDEGLCAQVEGVDLPAVHFEGSSAEAGAVAVPAVGLYEDFSVPIYVHPLDILSMALVGAADSRGLVWLLLALVAVAVG